MSLHAERIHLFAGKRQLCTDITITLKPGDILGILGQNGSGKTTLLHTLAGLQTPRFGDIYLHEQALKRLNKKYIAQQIGILLQEITVNLPIRVRDYCDLSRYPHLSTWQTRSAVDEHIIDEALSALDLHVLQHTACQFLSGGEKRRVALAALLAQTPAIYLLDEPTNHLDMRYQMIVLRHFQTLATRGHIIAATLHDINLAAYYCNQMLFLFPDGSHLQGLPADVMTVANLERLYQCPITRQGSLWSPMV